MPSTEHPRTVCQPFVGDTIGGSHLAALMLIETLDPARYRPLIVLHEEGVLADHLASRGIPFSILPLPTYVGRSRGAWRHARDIIRSAPPIVRFLRHNGVPLVHTHDNRMHLTWGLPTKLVGSQYVRHQHSNFGGAALTRAMLPLADAIVGLSRYGVAMLPEKAVARLEIVDNPFDTEADWTSPPDVREELLRGAGIDPQAKMVCFIGNIMERKRPLVFLEAAAIIKQKAGVPVVFPIFGGDRDGYEAVVHERVSALGLAAEVRFMGFRYPLEPWLAAADLLLAPQVGEPFGRTLVEAMLVGTPVIAAHSGAHPEIIDHGRNGSLCQADDPEAMAMMALDMLSQPDRTAELMVSARAKARKRYATGQHARAIMKIYDRLFAG